MNILLNNNYNSIVLKNSIGTNLNFNSKFKLASYVIKYNTGNTVILYNTISGLLVEMLKDEYSFILSSTGNDIIEKGWRFLIDRYTFVPENINDYDAVNTYLSTKHRYQTPVENNFDYIDKYVIFTTLDCNARCFYCYEHGASKIKMSSKIATDTADFIINEYNKTKTPIAISWFGGEPLYNIEAIDLITDKLIEAGVPFYSDITTNAYLFTEDVIEKAATKWNIKHAQITLDGTKEKYNKTKNYIYKDKNAFDKVIDNIKALLKHNIEVHIRLNADLYNVDDLTDLVKYLYEEVGNHSKLSVYTHELFEDVSNVKHTEEEKEQLFKKINILKRNLMYYKYMKDDLTVMKHCHCLTDGGHGIMILPDGKVGQCEHFYNKDYIGDIYTTKENWNYDVVANWRELYKKEEICKSCPLFAVCIPIKRCIGEHICGELEKSYKIDDYKIRMKRVYDKSLYTRNLNSSCDCNSKSNYSEVLSKIANELELANDYKSLTLLERIKLLFGFDVYRDPHKKVQDNFNGK